MQDNISRGIQVEELELVDRQGNLRALLALNKQTRLPFLAFYDDRGRQRVLVGLDRPNRTVLAMYRENGALLASCGDDEEGRVGLTLFDQHGAAGIIFVMHPNGERSIQILDSELEVVWARTASVAQGE